MTEEIYARGTIDRMHCSMANDAVQTDRYETMAAPVGGVARKRQRVQPRELRVSEVVSTTRRTGTTEWSRSSDRYEIRRHQNVKTADRPSYCATQSSGSAGVVGGLADNVHEIVVPVDLEAPRTAWCGDGGVVSRWGEGDLDRSGVVEESDDVEIIGLWHVPLDFSQPPQRVNGFVPKECSDGKN